MVGGYCRNSAELLALRDAPSNRACDVATPCRCLAVLVESIWLISLSGARRLLWAVVGERRGTNLGITLKEAVPVPLPVHHK